jgi:hypothetical protein
MFTAGTWKPGFPSVLTPLFAIIEGPSAQYRAALLLNALLAAAAMIVLYRLVLRLTELSDWAALAVTTAVALLPSSLASSAHVWAEPLITVTFLSALWSLLRYYDGSVAHAGLAVAWGLVGYATHGRMIPLLVAVVGLISVRAFRSRQWLALIVTFAATVVGVVALNWYEQWLVDRVWDAPLSGRSVTQVLGRLGEPLEVLDAGLGQLWYQLCATALLAGIGAVVLARRSLRSGADPRRTIDARITLVVTMPLVGLSVVYMSDRVRTDYLVYGRYNDSVVWPLVAVGAAWLIVEFRRESARVRLWMLGGLSVLLLELAFLLRQMHHRQLDDSRPIIDMIAGIVPMMSSPEHVDVFWVTALSLAGAVVVVAGCLLVSARPVLGCMVIVAVIAAGAFRTRAVFDDWGASWSDAEAIADAIEENVPENETVGIALVFDAFRPPTPYLTQYTFALMYQWYLPDREFQIDSGLDDDVGPYVVATNEDLVLIEGGATLLWVDEASSIALWREAAVPNR